MELRQAQAMNISSHIHYHSIPNTTFSVSLHHIKHTWHHTLCF